MITAPTAESTELHKEREAVDMRIKGTELDQIASIELHQGRDATERIELA